MRTGGACRHGVPGITSAFIRVSINIRWEKLVNHGERPEIPIRVGTRSIGELPIDAIYTRRGVKRKLKAPMPEYISHFGLLIFIVLIGYDSLYLQRV